MMIFYVRSEKKKKLAPEKSVNKVEEKFKSPFRIAPALKFAAFVLLIKFIA
ncbi:MAG: DUF4010 domain-containing protein [Candidatus Peribacteria bacterium]|jgi:uncharacterized membrane protein (DUF4010 family)|nr:DUF4010 domain-containing protein [Candidatus Peribacteria bacterium]